MAGEDPGELSVGKPPPRLPLPDVARLTAIPERTLQYWFREYGSYRSRRGYPLQLILDVLRDHEWEGDLSVLLRSTAEDDAQPGATHPSPSDLPVPFRAEAPLAAVARLSDHLDERLATFQAQQAELDAAILGELRELRGQATQVATLNELRGLREEILSLRVSQLAAERQQQVLLDALASVREAIEHRRPWWKFWAG